MFSGRKEDLPLNVPIVCGGVIVNPGDMVVADEIGITVVPKNKLTEVIDRAKEQADREAATHKERERGDIVVRTGSLRRARFFVFATRPLWG
jgi:regulator of RNase E activity RraA